MQFRGRKVSKNASDYVVHLSTKELEKWGRKMGFGGEEIVAVDTHVSEGVYETSVALGAHGSEEAKNHAVLYSVQAHLTTDPADEKLKYQVKFNLNGKFHNQERKELKGQTEYSYFVERKAYFRDAVDKFIRDIIKDGHLSFYPLSDEEVAAIAAQVVGK